MSDSHKNLARPKLSHRIWSETCFVFDIKCLFWYFIFTLFIDLILEKSHGQHLWIRSVPQLLLPPSDTKVKDPMNVFSHGPNINPRLDNQQLPSSVGTVSRQQRLFSEYFDLLLMEIIQAGAIVMDPGSKCCLPSGAHLCGAPSLLCLTSFELKTSKHPNGPFTQQDSRITTVILESEVRRVLPTAVSPPPLTYVTGCQVLALSCALHTWAAYQQLASERGSWAVILWIYAGLHVPSPRFWARVGRGRSQQVDHRSTREGSEINAPRTSAQHWFLCARHKNATRHLCIRSTFPCGTSVFIIIVSKNNLKL